MTKISKVIYSTDDLFALQAIGISVFFPSLILLFHSFIFYLITFFFSSSFPSHGRKSRGMPRTHQCTIRMSFFVRVPVLSENTCEICPRSSITFHCDFFFWRKGGERKKGREREREKEKKKGEEREGKGKNERGCAVLWGEEMERNCEVFAEWGEQGRGVIYLVHLLHASNLPLRPPTEWQMGRIGAAASPPAPSSLCPGETKSASFAMR